VDSHDLMHVSRMSARFCRCVIDSGQLSDSSLPTFRIRSEIPSPLLRSVAEHSARACHQISSIREMQEYS
jgi:hypothetical protein